MKDHLGNTRISFAADSALVMPLQYKDYYPFGLEMVDSIANHPDATKYLYNGKELQDEGGLDFYDYGARFYDPVLGRWHSVDPLAEMYNSCSPYTYVQNKPINCIDPNGMASVNKMLQDAWNSTPEGQDRTYNYNQDDDTEENDPKKSVEEAFSVTKKIMDFFGWGLNPDKPQDREKLQNAPEHLEQALVAIETTNGVLMVLVPASSVAELLANAQSGNGAATLATIPFVVLDAATMGEGSKVKLSRQVLNSWENVNFKSISSTIKYHVGKHGLNMSIAQYTEDALSFYNKNKQLGTPITLKNGAEAIKIRLGNGKPGGIFTSDGKIVSFWYK